MVALAPVLSQMQAVFLAFVLLKLETKLEKPMRRKLRTVSIILRYYIILIVLF